MQLLDEFHDLDENKRWNPTFQLMHLETRLMNEEKTQTISKLPQNRSKNRYRDVLPYDDTRVKLKTDEDDYVNANYVKSPLINNRRYILAQGPLPNTCEDFWRMIWENNSTAIIMLNRIVEKNMIKCHPYWPMGEEEVVEFGHFQIVNKSSQMDDTYIIRDLALTNTKQSKTRKIKQYHFVTWPDFGVPDNPQAFLDFLEKIKRSGALSDTGSPPVVHCSAGIGRSGTFCLVDAILAIAERDGSTDNIDIRKLLMSFRKCRCGLVQTAEQFRFANIAILHGLHVLFPDLFKDKEFFIAEDDGEPPPLPPRRTKGNLPPEKPDRSAKTEDTKQQILYKQILTESSEGSDEEEIIDLSDDETFNVIQPQEFTDTTTLVNHEDINVNIKTTTTEEDTSIIPSGSKASENNEVRHRLREKKRKDTKDLIENIKRRMKDSEEKSSFQLRHLFYAGAAIGVCVGMYVVITKWWS